MLRCFNHCMSAALVLMLLVGGVARSACASAACAAKMRSATVHCACCGLNDPQRKTTGESRKRDTACDQQCPMVAAGKLVAISNPWPMATAMLHAAELQPLFLGRTAPGPVPIYLT